MSDSGTVRILGIAGSLRRGSFNAAALRAARDLAPDGMTIEIFDLAPIPHVQRRRAAGRISATGG